MQLDHSPITHHCFNDIPFALKRDDLLHPQFSGNKARKLMTLLQIPSDQLETIISYGSAQANSLYSMSALAQLKGWSLNYYVDHIPSWLRASPVGNYAQALHLGATIIETQKHYGMSPSAYLANHTVKQNELFIPEGGRFVQAQAGITTLADELLTWINQQPKQQWVVALPSGTGTTALYLHKALAPHGIKVVTCACVGGPAYLQQQWIELGEEDHPQILDMGKKHHFGKLYQADWQLWQTLYAKTNIEFDLLYDPLMWQNLSAWWSHYNQACPSRLLYIHQGGVLGNVSMQARYTRKYGLESSPENTLSL